MQINHYSTVRMRALGSGDLQLILHGLGEFESQTLDSITLSANSSRFVNKLSNFKAVGASLELKVTELDEYFEIKSIVIYSKPIEMEYPQ